MKIYVGEKNISSWSMRGWVALKHKGVPFEEVTISLREDKDRSRRRAVSPTGKVPALHDGTIVISDSLAIIEYLEETYPAPNYPALWPAQKEKRAHARWLAAAMHSGFMEIRKSMSFNICFSNERPKPSAEALVEAEEMLQMWEQALASRAEFGPYLFGSFSAADVMFAPAVVRLLAFDVSTNKAPLAAAYMKAVVAQPSVKEWLDAARALPPHQYY